MEGHFTHSPGRIGYASGKLPYNRLSGEVVIKIAIPVASVRFADYSAK
jgi:hypothetical protein